MPTKTKTPKPLKSVPLPDTGFVRMWQFLGDEKRGILPIIPISRTTFLNKVKSGEYPQPKKLGVSTNAWKVEDIRALIKKMGA
jgi:predicted DNA-binding transcriptional regulator AlpA